MSAQLPLDEYKALFRKLKGMTEEEREKWGKDNNIPDDDDFAGFDSSKYEE